MELCSDGTVEPVTHPELESWFTELELAPRFLPNPPRAVDAYERATGAVRAKGRSATHRAGARSSATKPPARP